MIDHSGERGFCAGGDIRMLAESGAGDGKAAREFFHTEYRLNHLLFHATRSTPSPSWTASLMGGGVGLSRPCRFRIATERTTFAMPETGIGLFPDVGGGWYLPRMPEHIGVWLALTGARIKAADCELLGIATDYIASADVERFKAGLIAEPRRHGDILLTELEADAGRPVVAQYQDEINRSLRPATVEADRRRARAGRDRLGPRAAEGAGHQVAADHEGRLPVRCSSGSQARTFAENMATEYRIGARVVQPARLPRGRPRGDRREGQCAPVESAHPGRCHRGDAG
jgi:enoyl-CoA hydratase